MKNYIVFILFLCVVTSSAQTYKGVCGAKGNEKNVRWEITSDNSLIIDGEGKMISLHKDTDKILLVYVGNLIFNAIIMIINFIVLFMMAFGVGMVVRSEKISGLITHFLYTITVGFLLWIWAKVGLWLTMKTSRNNEFEADEFSFELGYGVGLCSGLDAITGGEAPAKGVFASLAASHPATDDRIARLQSLGCNYYRGR